jgi:hypothetical protein
MKTVNGWLQPDGIGRYGKDYDTCAGGDDWRFAISG